MTLAHSFASLLFGATFDVASYNRWLLAKRSDAHTHAFRWHRKLLQYLQLIDHSCLRLLQPELCLLQIPHGRDLLELTVAQFERAIWHELALLPAEQ